jgi:hypothetical protein
MSLPSSSTTLIQIIGRSLRLHPEKNIANIILPFSKRDDENAICNFMKVMSKNDSRIRKSYDNKKLGGYFDIVNIIDDDEDKNDTDLMNDIEVKYELIFDSIGKMKNGEEIWMKKFEELKLYIDVNKKRPSKCSFIKNIKILGLWTSTQISSYKNKKNIMRNDIVYNIWDKFINSDNYKEYFLPNSDLWYNNLEQLKKYININKKLPSIKYKDIKSLCNWMNQQKYNYNTRKDIMKDDTIYNNFKIFLENYKEYFISSKERWNNNLENIKKYININNELPSNESKNEETQYLCRWIWGQKTNYNIRKYSMKDDIIYNTFKDFLEIYKKYFLSNEEKWDNYVEDLKKYIDTNHKLPSKSDNKSLEKWLSHQKNNLKNCSGLMKDDIIYNKFKDFLDIYKDYLLTYDEIWNNKLKNVIKYIEEHKKKPSAYDKNKKIKELGNWISIQKQNLKKKDRIMKNEINQNIFNNFLEKYKEYF